MNMEWINAAVIVGALFATVIGLRHISRVKLRRMRSLECPRCRTRFAVPGFWTVRRWTDWATLESGFYLHCDECAEDYRLSCSCRLLGRAERTE